MGGTIRYSSPQSKNWGGRVPPIPFRIDAPENIDCLYIIQLLYFRKLKGKDKTRDKAMLTKSRVE